MNRQDVSIGATGPGGMTVFLETDQSIGNLDFLSLGTSSASFVRNTLVVPQDATITGLVLNIRDNALGTGNIASAEIFISTNCGFGTPEATGIIASITGPNSAVTPNCCAFAAADFAVEQCDLITVRITTGGGAFAGGVAATILLSTTTP
ncbi:hypothetical protein ACQKL5_07610 [Peribacillus sp. NPDC097675]|uniref:hypothetical protein n=1 Tax=Peribacillus sp. NPDC097675 TaxID=3390618 RepID=UPI003D057E7E